MPHTPPSTTVLRTDMSTIMQGDHIFTDSTEHSSLIQACHACEDDDILGCAFPRKMAVHAGFGGSPVPGDERDSELLRIEALPRSGKTAAYIHVPFCESHCLYCGFFTGGYNKLESARYVSALRHELDMWTSRQPDQSSPVHCVYFGGGTPTALEANDLNQLIRAVRDVLPVANDCEITVEGRIHNFGPDKMEACLAAGANRFSLGVQTFDTILRRSMARKAAKEDIVSALRRLAEYDQAAVVIDLIYGFPGQDMDVWRRDLETVLDLELDGVDLYQLNTFPGTPLYRAVEKGDLPQPAGTSMQGRMYAMGCAILENARWNRLSSSHYGRTQRERNLYNHMVKGPAHCLAFGPGAGGALHGCSYFLERTYDRWREELTLGRKPVAGLMRTPPDYTRAKTLAQEFDKGHINLTRLGRRLGVDLAELAAPITAQWVKTGLMRSDGAWLDLTVAGHFWQVTMAHLLINYFNTCTQEGNA